MSKPPKIIFNKYQIKKLIAKTRFGWLYEGINIKDKESVAMKIEKRISKYNLLESEAYMLYLLKGFGIPKLISYGKSGSFNILIEELLGLSIQAIWNNKKYNKKYKTKDICMIALQCLDRLEYIHSKDIIHRDIKPLNVTIGKENPNVIYLIDFGFAHKFRSTRTGKHIKFKNLKKILGSMRYLSINANKGNEQSRRDDLESLGYMLIYLSNNTLPWIEHEGKDILKIKKYKLVLQSKSKISDEKLCSGLPKEFMRYLTYVKKLEFEQDPNYNYMRQLFLEVLNKNNFINDLMFSWILNKKIKMGNDTKSLDNKSYDRSVSLNSRKRENSQKRLYHKIKNSLEKDTARSQDERRGHKKLNINIFNNNLHNLKIKSEYISQKKTSNNNIKNLPLIYKRKKINNIKIIKKEPKVIINKKTSNNIFDKSRNIKTFININDKYESSPDKFKNLKINNSSNLINMNILKNLEIKSYNIPTKNIYRTLKERKKENSYNKTNNNPIKKNSKIRIIDISRNKHNISPISKKISEYNNNIYKSPQNIFNNRYHLKNISFNNFDDNTFKSNGLGFSFESKNNNDIINLKISSEDLKPNIKINKNYNINIINKKRINSSTNLFNSNDYNRNINNYNYIPFVNHRKKTSFIF